MNAFDLFMKDNPLIWGIFCLFFVLCIIVYSIKNTKYSKRRLKELELELKDDSSKYFNYGLNKSIFYRAIVSIIFGIGFVFYGIFVIIGYSQNFREII